VGLLIRIRAWLLIRMRYLQDGHLVPQLALLLGGEPHLIDDLDGHVSTALPVFP